VIYVGNSKVLVCIMATISGAVGNVPSGASHYEFGFGVPCGLLIRCKGVSGSFV